MCNVLPIVWLTDSKLIVPELDRDFYESIPEFKKGYMDMYPETKFLGDIFVERIVDCNRSEKEKSAAFFSAGLDATTTLFRHIDERPDLISIWGSDIGYDNISGWSVVQSAIDHIAEDYGLHHCNIRSSFRLFDNEGVLHSTFAKQLKDGWWHGIQHSIGLMGHAAPYAWLHRITKIYFASTYSVDMGKVRCASYPTIDNYVRFCGTQMSHDGYELNRQKKVEYVVAYKQRTNINVHLHVCWESSEGTNCCHCEKCYRTIAGILVAGDDPKTYGFDINQDTLSDMKQYMMNNHHYSHTISLEWQAIQKVAREHKAKYSKELNWIITYNFIAPEKNWCRRKKNILYMMCHPKATVVSKFPRLYK